MQSPLQWLGLNPLLRRGIREPLRFQPPLSVACRGGLRRRVSRGKKFTPEIEKYLKIRLKINRNQFAAGLF